MGIWRNMMVVLLKLLSFPNLCYFPPTLQVHFFHPTSVTWFHFNKSWSSNVWNLVAILTNTDICNYRIWKIKTNNHLVTFVKTYFPKCQVLPFKTESTWQRACQVLNDETNSDIPLHALHLHSLLFSHPRPSFLIFLFILLSTAVSTCFKTIIWFHR